MIAKQTVDALLETKLSSGKTVDERMKEAISTIGEKLSIRRFEIRTKSDNDAFGAYLHMGGRIGVLTVVEGSTDEEALKMLLCTSRYQSKYVSSEQVKEEEINHEREVLKQQALNEGKPENIVEKWLKVVYVNIFKKFVQLIKTSLKIQIKQLKLS